MTLFSFRGIPVRLHNTFFIIAIFLVISGLLSGGPTGALSSIILVILLFGSVLLHEMGHALAAEYYGIRTRNITLHILGGLAAIEKPPKTPVEEICIAIAGPAVNLLLLALAAPLVTLGVPGSYELAFVNLIMGVFNLIPAYPMDGGRILRAALSMKFGHTRATEISLIIASIFGAVFVIIGMYAGWFGLTLIGGFLLFVTYAQKNGKLR